MSRMPIELTSVASLGSAAKTRGGAKSHESDNIVGQIEYFDIGFRRLVWVWLSSGILATRDIVSRGACEVPARGATCTQVS